MVSLQVCLHIKKKPWNLFEKNLFRRRKSKSIFPSVKNYVMEFEGSSKTKSRGGNLSKVELILLDETVLHIVHNKIFDVENSPQIFTSFYLNFTFKDVQESVYVIFTNSKDGLISGSIQFSLLPQLPQKTIPALKVTRK